MHNTYNRNRIEPPFRPLPNGIEETRRANNKDPIQRLRVMRCSQRGSIAHMIPQAPKLRKADLGDIHNIVTLADGRLRMLSIRYRRAEWQDEATKVLIQREQT